MNKKIKLIISVLFILFLISSMVWSISLKKNKKGTYVVPAGTTFNGGGASIGGVGDGSQSESQPAVFKLEKGANLKNVVIKPPAGDGIHCAGNNVIENVVFPDVGEDAISMGGSKKNGGTVTVRNCKFTGAADKVFQVNAASTWNIINCTVNGAGKVLRQNGGKTFPLTVNINGLKATGVKEAVVRSDSPSCKVNWKNITCNLSKDNWWMGKLKANGSGGSSGSDPRKDYSSKGGSKKKKTTTKKTTTKKTTKKKTTKKKTTKKKTTTKDKAAAKKKKEAEKKKKAAAKKKKEAEKKKKAAAKKKKKAAKKKKKK